MKCPECGENGINAFAKMSLMFNLELRCKNCGTLFVLNKGFECLVGFTLQLTLLYVIVYSFINLNEYIVYFGSVLGLLFIGLITLLLPMKVKSKIGFRGELKHNKRINSDK